MTGFISIDGSIGRGLRTRRQEQAHLGTCRPTDHADLVGVKREMRMIQRHGIPDDTYRPLGVLQGRQVVLQAPCRTRCPVHQGDTLDPIGRQLLRPLIQKRFLRRNIVIFTAEQERDGTVRRRRSGIPHQIRDCLGWIIIRSLGS